MTCVARYSGLGCVLPAGHAELHRSAPSPLRLDALPCSSWTEWPDDASDGRASDAEQVRLAHLADRTEDSSSAQPHRFREAD